MWQDTSHLRSLNLCYNKSGVSGVEPHLLASAVCKLEEIILDCTRLTRQHVTTLFQVMKENSEQKVKSQVISTCLVGSHICWHVWSASLKMWILKTPS